MEILLGFVIALAISLTGVGAGSMTTPLLILLLGVSPATAVGTALAFGTVVKVLAVPVYAVRRQVHVPTLLRLMAGGLPGVIGGGFLLAKLKDGPYQAPLYAILGGLIVVTALFHLWKQIRPGLRQTTPDRSSWLPWLAFPIGAEVGFSSAGAGALGSLLLLSFTPLATAMVVGTDLCFGLSISFIGSIIQVSSGNYDLALLSKLVTGGVFGALLGSFLAGKVAQRPLRVGLLTMLVILGFQLAVHSASPNAHPKPASLQARIP